MLHRLFGPPALFVAAALAWGTATAHRVGIDQGAALSLSQSVVGRPVGDFTLYDRTGRRITLAAYRGKPLLVNFVYTACAQVCPIATQFLAKAVAQAQRAAGPGSFNILTIGFNLPHDTPQAMADFARRSAISLPNWEFASPEPGSVEALAQAFGFSYVPTQGGFDHIAQVTLVDAAGTIVRQIYGDSFELPALVEPLKQAAAGRPAARYDVAQLVEKVRVLCTVYDPASGRYRFNYALIIEILAAVSTTAAVLIFLVRERRRTT